ncbi:hypothetical protein LCGC14_0812240 [marine sediment metagenome]|uniref:Uncharacterized protein n=1 Tax=marine sediment metagenome TaxID=412755 RepID=A0A0F9S6A6_9ZZZZ
MCPEEDKNITNGGDPVVQLSGEAHVAPLPPLPRYRVISYTIWGQWYESDSNQFAEKLSEIPPPYELMSVTHYPKPITGMEKNSGVLTEIVTVAVFEFRPPAPALQIRQIPLEVVKP